MTDFLVTPLPFGYYSSEPKVRNWIREMKGHGQAFYSESAGIYFLAGVLFQRQAPGSDDALPADISDQLAKVMKAF